MEQVNTPVLPKKPIKQKIIQFILRFWLWGLVLIFFLVVLFAIGTYVFFLSDLATAERLMNRNNTGFVLTDRNEEIFFKSEGVKDFSVVPIAHIPKTLQEATVAIEDKDFFKHVGFSPFAIIRSLYSNLRLFSFTRYGGSTITQQLVKNALLSSEKTITRKFQELVLAIEIDRRYTKDQILEMYLNSIYYGSGAYGVTQAAETYFGKQLADLTLSEIAVLAALPQAPSRFSPFSGDTEALYERKDIVLDRMAEQGLITSTEKEQAQKAKLRFAKEPTPEVSIEAPHFAVFVREYLYQKYGEENVNRLGFRVKTSLDLRLQSTAQKAVASQVKRLANQKVSNAGLVSFDPHTGEILSMVGSVNWGNESFGKLNIVFAKRQPGSAFKPIVYTLAFQDGAQPIDILHDKETDFAGYKPKNYDGKFRGDVTMRRALANSLNVPAVALLQEVGVDRAISFAQDFGITTFSDPSRYGLSLVLGGGEVELFQLTRAYGVLATGGLFVPTHPILSIEDKLGNAIYTYNPFTKKEDDRWRGGLSDIFQQSQEPFKEESIGGQGGRRVVDEVSAYFTTHILSDNSARAEIFGSSSALLLSRQAAAKTGTTDDFRDSWTIGYTADIVTGVWVGNNDNSPMGRIAGSVGAAPIWHEFMEAAHKGREVREFPRPAGVAMVEICADTFARFCSGCNQKITEIYRKDDVPDNICPEDFTPTPEPPSEFTPTEPGPTDIPTETPESTDVPPTDIPIPTPTPTKSGPTVIIPTNTPIPIFSPTSIPLPPSATLVPSVVPSL